MEEGIEQQLKAKGSSYKSKSCPNPRGTKGAA